MTLDGTTRTPADGGRRLDARQAADRLGVKVETLYAYVSRGLIASERGPDGRRSTYLASDVERLAVRGRPRRSSRGPTVDVSIWTSITEIDGRHLRFRGKDAVELATSATFEQVADLLWYGTSSDPPPRWPRGRVPTCLPESGSMLDLLRAAVALDACRPRPSPRMDHDGASELLAEGPGLLATMVDSLPIAALVERTRLPQLRLLDGVPVEDSIAARMAVRLTERRASAGLVRALNAALVLLADHEMASSTFAARIAASVRADAHAVVSAGLGPLAGPYHGQAPTAVRRMISEAERTSPTAVARRMAQRTGPVAGVGHGLYPHGDPRAVALLAAVSESGGSKRRWRLVEDLLAAFESEGVGRPNSDFALGAFGHVWSMPVDSGEALFAVARSAGWLAHGAEEWDRRPVRFRARARYSVAPVA